MLDIFSVAVVLIRVVAFFIIAGAMSAIPAVWAALKYAANPAQGNESFNLAIIVGAGSHLLLALLLLIYAKTFARFMTKGLENTHTQLNEPNYNSLQAVAFSILGVYVLLYAIPTLIKLVVIEFLPSDSDSSTGYLFLAADKQRVPIEVLVEYAAQVALGLWLVLGSKGMATRLRSFWMKSISADSTE